MAEQVTYQIKDKKWYGSTVTVFPPHSGGYTIELNENTTQKQLQTLYNIEHPAVEIKPAK